MKTILISCITILMVFTNLNAQTVSSNQKVINQFFPYYEKFSIINLELSSNIDFPTILTRGGMGGSMDIGLNLGRMIKKNLLIAPYGGFSVLAVGNYRDQFITQLNSDYRGVPQRFWDLNDNVSSLSESEREEYNSYGNAIDELNEISNNNITSKLSFYYGVKFKLPIRYFPIIKFYKSHQTISGSSDRTVGTILSGGSATGSVKGSLGRIVMNGMGIEVDVFTGWLKDNMRLAQLSIYSEWYNFSSVKIGQEIEDTQYHNSKKLPIQTFINSSGEFTNTYKKEFRMGIKLGISLI